MSGAYILAHDLGTSGNKATLFDAAGRLVDSAFAPYTTQIPSPNWAEQEPQAWWEAVCTTSQKLLDSSGVPATEIAAVGFSGMMMGCLPVDAQGTPLRSCIIWADQRAQAEAALIAARCGADEVYQRCGHRTSPAYVAPKILWVRAHQPEIYARAAKFLAPKDYIVQRLTSEFATDYSDASGTLLFDLIARRWHQPFLEALDLSADQLPTPYPSNTVVGRVTPQAARASGLAPGTPVVIGGGDGSCAGVGAGVIEPGAAYCVIGTSACVDQRQHAGARTRSTAAHHDFPSCASAAIRANGRAADGGRGARVGMEGAGGRRPRSGCCCCDGAARSKRLDLSTVPDGRT